APGSVSSTSDLWSVSTTKESIMGITAHWIDVSEDGWMLKGSAIAFKGVAGNHSGRNLARYFWACGKRVGIFDAEHVSFSLWSKLLSLQCRCLAHVVNLATVDIMGFVTQIGLAESSTLIWEYNPADPENRVLGGQLDVIASIRTLTVKIQSSCQRIQHFHVLQNESGIKPALKIPLHSNI
ncbi:hypothetical protein SISNIDRAFT_398927, partial [Sistotremastrum niveocremeum HHB9708]